MTRPYPSMRGAKLYRARLCLAGPRVRSQVSVQALEPGLARAEPEVNAQNSISDSPGVSVSSPADVTAVGVAPTADHDGAVWAATDASTDAAGSVSDEVPSDGEKPMSDTGSAEPEAETANADSAAVSEAGSSTAAVEVQEEPVQYITPEEFPYQVGDIVTGRVVFANARGARVAIHGCTNVLGYLPKNRGPHAIRSARAKNPYVDGGFEQDRCVPKGLTRRFTIVAVPEGMSKGGKGPLLACNNLDLDILWGRLSTVEELAKSMRETIRVEVHGCVERGLLITLFGIRGFVPISHVKKDEGQDWLAKSDLEKFVGQEIEVSLMVVDREKYSFTASMINAESDRLLRRLRIGSLVWCRVRRMTDYGAFVSIENTFESALLHITNVSWHRVPTIDSVFSEGDRVRAVVIGMDDGFTRLSVSTRDLEEQEGDMLRDPQAVYDNAERGVQRFLEHVAEWEAGQARNQ